MSRLFWHAGRENSTLQVEGVNQFTARMETEQSWALEAKD